MGSLDLKEMKKTMNEVKAGIQKGINESKEKGEFSNLKKGITSRLKKSVADSFGKAIKAQKFGPALFCVLTGLCILLLLYSIIVACCLNVMKPGAITQVIVFLPLSMAGIIFFLIKLSKELSEVEWLCDSCSSDMDASYEFLEKEVVEHTPSKRVITGSHYELSNDEDGKLIAKHVLEGYDDTGRTRYYVKGTVKVKLKCKSCDHQQEFIARNISFTSFDSEKYDDALIKKAILKD